MFLNALTSSEGSDGQEEPLLLLQLCQHVLGGQLSMCLFSGGKLRLKSQSCGFPHVHLSDEMV